ncbi:peroxisome biogenesis factor 10 [Parasteatoda tepidariorum]|uniref:peroxisome biogenesis factor 10 n=1 Tax=Parasteatoda tepidariorum TaxID=114398 RepID=UPI00077F81C6|nr:peroxisome biogenesis factor 10 [Parasteatoda tepidariorum]
MSKHQAAGTAEILRSAQKDEESLRYMRHIISDITQRCLGIPFWMKWKDLSNTCSDFLFFSLTTLSGLQTLGEEYSNIIQVDKSLTSIPSKWIRLKDIIIKTFGHYFLLRYQTYLENKLAIITPSPSADNDPIIAAFIAHLPTIFKAIAIMQRIHLIAFYFTGSYYDFSKRLTGIKYVVIRRWLTNPAYQTSYKFLAWIAASQLCLSLVISAYSAKIKNTATCKDKEEKQNPSEVISLRNQCFLCFDKRSSSTATPCGHLFCWSCITSWMQNKEECPLCRESFPPSKLVLLQNYY